MNTTDAYDPIMDAQEAANNYSIPDPNQVVSEPNEVRKKKNMGERLADSTKSFADATGKYASAAFTPIKPFVAKQYGSVKDYGAKVAIKSMGTYQGAKYAAGEKAYDTAVVAVDAYDYAKPKIIDFDKSMTDSGYREDKIAYKKLDHEVERSNLKEQINSYSTELSETDDPDRKQYLQSRILALKKQSIELDRKQKNEINHMKQQPSVDKSYGVLKNQSKSLGSAMPTFGKTPSLSNLPGGDPNFIKPYSKTNTSLTRGGNMVVSTHGFTTDDEFRIMRGVNPYIPQRNIKGSLSTTGYSGIKKIPVSPKTSFNNIQNPRGTMNFDNYGGGGIKDAIKMGAVQNSMRAQYARRNKPQKQMFVNDIVEDLTDSIMGGAYRVAGKNTRTYQPDSLTKNKPSDITGKMGNMLKSSMRSNAVVTRKGFSSNKSNMDMNFGIGKNIGANLQNVIKSVSTKKKKTKR